MCRVARGKATSSSIVQDTLACRHRLMKRAPHRQMQRLTYRLARTRSRAGALCFDCVQAALKDALLDLSEPRSHLQEQRTDIRSVKHRQVEADSFARHFARGACTNSSSQPATQSLSHADPRGHVCPLSPHLLPGGAGRIFKDFQVLPQGVLVGCQALLEVRDDGACRQLGRWVGTRGRVRGAGVVRQYAARRFSRSKTWCTLQAEKSCVESRGHG